VEHRKIFDVKKEGKCKKISSCYPFKYQPHENAIIPERHLIKGDKS
jgi:hypothetical protein